MALIGALLWLLTISPLQRILDAVREDDRVAASLGINVTYIRLITFAVGAAIGGALYGHFMNFVRPDNFDVLLSIYVVLYVILGGVNNMFGAVLGAAVMTLLPEYFRVLTSGKAGADAFDKAAKGAGLTVLETVEFSTRAPIYRLSPSR